MERNRRIAVYIADLKLGKLSSFVKFAAGCTSIVPAVSDVSVVQSELLSTIIKDNEWSLPNELSLNLNKTKKLVFRRPHPHCYIVIIIIIVISIYNVSSPLTYSPNRQRTFQHLSCHGRLKRPITGGYFRPRLYPGPVVFKARLLFADLRKMDGWVDIGGVRNVKI